MGEDCRAILALFQVPFCCGLAVAMVAHLPGAGGASERPVEDESLVMRAELAPGTSELFALGPAFVAEDVAGLLGFEVWSESLVLEVVQGRVLWEGAGLEGEVSCPNASPPEGILFADGKRRPLEGLLAGGPACVPEGFALVALLGAQHELVLEGEEAQLGRVALAEHGDCEGASVVSAGRDGAQGLAEVGVSELGVPFGADGEGVFEDWPGKTLVEAQTSCRVKVVAIAPDCPQCPRRPEDLHAVAADVGLPADAVAVDGDPEVGESLARRQRLVVDAQGRVERP